jgi:hypothetical protein
VGYPPHQEARAHYLKPKAGLHGPEEHEASAVAEPLFLSSFSLDKAHSFLPLSRRQTQKVSRQTNKYEYMAITKLGLLPPKLSRFLQAAALAGAIVLGPAAHAAMVITPTFTANFNANFGANAAAAQAAWISAAGVYTANFSDNIHINITVDAVPGTSVFGQSSTFLNGTTYANLRALVVADAKTPDDFTSIGPGGSVTVADPSGGSEWWVSRAEAKALGMIPDDLSNDGTTTFGAGNPFTFAGPISAGTYDFKGVCAHEIAEVMGRLGISGGTVGSFANSYSLIDDFSYTGAATKLIGKGASSFSIDNGTTLLKAFNNALANGLDSRDWAPGTDDSFNQFSNPGVVNPVSPVDLREMDVIGYDRIIIPEPAAGALLFAGRAAAALGRRRTRA